MLNQVNGLPKLRATLFVNYDGLLKAKTEGVAIMKNQVTV
jgi:hypothetical protein